MSYINTNHYKQVVRCYTRVLVACQPIKHTTQGDQIYCSLGLNWNQRFCFQQELFQEKHGDKEEWKKSNSDKLLDMKCQQLKQ